MTNREWQKYAEHYALNILTDELKISCDSITESESPDFLFEYEGKRIGAEIVEYHRNPKEIEARKSYQKVVDKFKSKQGKLTSITVFDEDLTTFNKKKSEKQLLKDIENLLSNQNYEAQHLQSAEEWDINVEDNLPVSVCSVGVCQHVKTDILEQAIRRKEKKLIEYKKSNTGIDEYWLIVYVNLHERDYFENMEKPEIITSYDRIYLTHLTDKVLRIK